MLISKKNVQALSAVLLGTHLFAGITSGSPVQSNVSGNEVVRRQTIVVPECTRSNQWTMTVEEADILFALWGDAFGTYANDLGLGWNEIRGVCCNGACMYVDYRGDEFNRVTWSDEGFRATYPDLREELGVSTWRCSAPLDTTNRGDDDPYTALHVDALGNLGGRDLTEIIGDTCNGAPGYQGNYLED